MKKLLIALPLVIGGSWAGASYFTGTQTQDAYDHLLAQMNESGLVVLVNERYDAGVVNSSAVTHVMDSSAADASVLFRLQHAINHSPIGVNEGVMRVGAATITTTLLHDEAIPESLRAFLQGFDDLDPVKIDTAVKFDGSMVHQLLVNAYEYQYEDVDVRYDGIEYTLENDGEKMTGVGTTGVLVISSEDTVMRLSPGKISNELTLEGDSIVSGGYSVLFDKLTVTGPRVPVSLALKSIDMASTVNILDGKVDFDTRYSIGNIDSPLPLNSASIDTRVWGVSLSGLERYVEVASQMAVSDLSPDELALKLSAVIAAATGIIGPGTGLSYELELGNDGGKGNLLATGMVVEETSPNYPVAGLASVVTLRDALTALQFEIILDTDSAAIDQSPLGMFMGMPAAQQFIVAEGGKYKSDITVQDLVVDINGNPMSLEMMLGKALDMPLATLMDSI